jgi:uncharacterized protein (DUF2384 family)
MSEHEEIHVLYGVDEGDLDFALNNNAADHEEKLRALFAFALSYFGSTVATRSWFSSLNLGLGGVTPLSLLDTDYGIDRVKNTIYKLMHGMTA